MNITEEQISCALLRVNPGLDKYLWIQSKVDTVDIETDREFQKRFNGFYRVRRNNSWQAIFYKIFKEVKSSNDLGFSNVLEALEKKTGQIEASFSSKLIATLDQEKPVIDKFVLNNSGLKLPHAKTKDRKKKIAIVYSDLESKYREFLKSELGKELVKRFREKFPEAKVTEIKMADLVFWQTRAYPS